jgi:hypothetical protein
MAQDNRFDPARLERIERRLRVLEDGEAIRNLKARYAALCDNQYDADGIASLFTEGRGLGEPRARPLRGAGGDPQLFPRRVEYLLLRDPLQSERPYRDRRRSGASPLVSVHAVHAGRRESGGVARRYRSRDLRAGGWHMDVPPQAVGAADERPIRNWLGQDALRMTDVHRLGDPARSTRDRVQKRENAT